MPRDWERVCEDHPREDTISDYAELADHAREFHGGREDFGVVWRRHIRWSEPEAAIGW